MKVSLLDSKVEKFIRELDDQTYAKVLRVMELLEQFGNHIGLPHSKRLQKDVYELRTQGHPLVRLLYTFHKGDYFVVHGFIKKTQKTPRRELELAVTKIRRLRHT